MIPNREEELIYQIKVLITRTLMVEGVSNVELLTRLGEKDRHLWAGTLTVARVAKILAKVGKRLKVEIEDDV